MQNPSFPGFDNTEQTCVWTIKKCADNICFLRLDYDVFALDGPDITGQASCLNDIWSFDDESPQTIAPVCGGGDGFHMYMRFGDPSDSQDITITGRTAGSTFSNRRWDVVLRQIPCGANYAPPVDCYQYLTGVSGQVRSFNYIPPNGEVY